MCNLWIPSAPPSLPCPSRQDALYNFTGLVLGHGGATVQRIQKASGAKVEVRNPGIHALQAWYQTVWGASGLAPATLWVNLEPLGVAGLLR